MRQDDEDLIGLTPLYDVFYDHLPHHRGKQRNRIDIRKIGADLGISFQAVNRWFVLKKASKTGISYYLPPDWMRPLCNLEGSTLTEEILRPYTVLG